MTDEYNKLEAEFTRLYRLNHFLRLGRWDQQVMMPPGGGASRAESFAALQQVIHAAITAPQLAAWLEACEAPAAAAALTEAQRANVREMRRRWRLETALSEEFMARKTRLISRSDAVWREARRLNKVELFLPVLQEVVDLAREEGRTLAAAAEAGGTAKTPYEALMDAFHPGLTTAQVDEIFADVKSWLPRLLQDIRERQALQPPVVPLSPPFPVEAQQRLARKVLKIWEFDFDAGRLDAAPHPMTIMTPEDIRLTTHFDVANPLRGLLFTIHEGGHALYRRRCGPAGFATQPVNSTSSYIIDESQSLLGERVIARSAAFAEVLTPMLVEAFGPQPAFTVDNITRTLNRVEPGFIRLEADEVCYPLHIILRYEIERDLIAGTLAARDVPKVWNAKMKEYLGLDVGDRDDLGCLQDIQWSAALFGYFPTYSLGAMFAAQLMATIRKEVGGEAAVQDAVRRGDLSLIFDKQHEKIWQHGCLYEPEDLIQRATGEPLNPRYFREHLTSKYLGPDSNTKL